jgi:hypothetical protein
MFSDAIGRVVVGTSGYTLPDALCFKDGGYWLESHCRVSSTPTPSSTLKVTLTERGWQVEVDFALVKANRRGWEFWKDNGRKMGYGHPEVVLVINGGEVLYTKPEASSEPDPLPVVTGRLPRVSDMKVGDIGFAGLAVLYRRDGTFRLRDDCTVHQERAPAHPVIVRRTNEGWQVDVRHVPADHRVFANLNFGPFQHEVVRVFDDGVELKCSEKTAA